MQQLPSSIIRLGAVCLFSLSLTACQSWVQLTPEGSNVNLVGDASRVANCTRVGRANVQTLGKIVVVADHHARPQQFCPVFLRWRDPLSCS